MADDSPIDVEGSLASAVRNYLLQPEAQDYRISEDENLRPVCMWLGAFLQDLLRNEEGWSQYAWVDGVSPCTADRVSPSELAFTGLLIWVDGNKAGHGNKGWEWKEPLFAAIAISDDDPTHLTYELRCGDADRGLRKCSYGSAHDFPYVPVENWLFTLFSEDTRE